MLALQASLAVVLLLLAVRSDALHTFGEPRQVIVVHRHGARSTLVTVNQSDLCPSYGCGVLNSEGKDMLYHLGLYLRATYNETLQPYDRYDSLLFHSQSTDFARTIQSAGAMLRGLFSHLEGTPQQVYPVIHTKAVGASDKLLVWNSWPTILVYFGIFQPDFNQMVETISSSYLDVTTLAAIGEEIGLNEECQPNASRYNNFQCGLDAQDFFVCAAAEGREDAYPLAKRWRGALDQYLELYNSYSMWGFDEAFNGGMWLQAIGTFGYLLAMDIVLQARTSAAVLQHYSGHDTTLMPLWMTLGNYSLTNPLFGAAMVFEMYGNQSNVSSLWIWAKIGQPGQLPGNHSYDFEPFQLLCTDEWNITYPSTEGCPLDDFERFVATRGPSSSEGICFVDSQWLWQFNCTANNSNFYSSELCMMYREKCISACGSEGAMRDDYSCVA